MAKEKEENTESSDAYRAFEALIEAYKVSNPVKYEIKKDELARKLAALK